FIALPKKRSWADCGKVSRVGSPCRFCITALLSNIEIVLGANAPHNGQKDVGYNNERSEGAYVFLSQASVASG
ncbi:hypothetical protein, partial [Alteromonas aestuariivivens]|uniref:hypothetical protein n=1 Tax=Alteromonas aestuariivivens TaxID=1938339 RepID=UPI001C69796B